MRKIATVAVVILLVLSARPVRANQDDVSIEVTPRTAVVLDKTAYIRIVIRIRRHSENRNLVLKWESEDGESGRKDRQLEGEDSQIVFDTADPNFFGRQGLQLSPGHYTISVTVERASGKDPRTSQQMVVRKGGDIDDDY